MTYQADCRTFDLGASNRALPRPTYLLTSVRAYRRSERYDGCGFYRFPWPDEDAIRPDRRSVDRIGPTFDLRGSRHWPRCRDRRLYVFAESVAFELDAERTVLRCLGCGMHQSIHPAVLADVAEMVGPEIGARLTDANGYGLPEAGPAASVVLEMALSPWQSLLVELDMALAGSDHDTAVAHARTLPAAGEIGMAVAAFQLSNGAEYTYFNRAIRMNADWGTKDQRQALWGRETAAAEVMRRVSAAITEAHEAKPVKLVRIAR